MLDKINPFSGYQPQTKVAKSAQPVNNQKVVERGGKVYTVMVGVSDYKYVGNLDYADKDARDMKEALCNSEKWKDADGHVLCNEAATKERIKNSILEYSGKLGPQDTFFFFFSGHGTNQYGKAFIAPHDANIDFWGNGYNLISESDLRSWLQSLAKDSANPPKVAVVLDSCFSGGAIDERGDKSLNSKFIKLKGSDYPFLKGGFEKELGFLKNSVILTASDNINETAVDSLVLKNGAFTYYIVDGLGRGAEIGSADINRNNKVSMEELYEYANPRVKEFLKDGRHPGISDNYEGELDIKY